MTSRYENINAASAKAEAGEKAAGSAVVCYSTTALTMGLGGAEGGWKVATEATKLGARFAANYPMLAEINTAIFSVVGKLAKPNTKFYTFYIGPRGKATPEIQANRLKTNLALFGAGVGILSAGVVCLFVPHVVVAAGAYNLVVLPASYGLLQVAATSGTALTGGVIAVEATAIAVRLYNDPTEISDAIAYNKLWCFMNIAGGIVLGAKAAGYTHNLAAVNAKVIGGLAGTISCLVGGQDAQPHANKIAPEAPETMVDTVISGVKTAFNVATFLACGVAIGEYAYTMVGENMFARNHVEHVARGNAESHDGGLAGQAAYGGGYPTEEEVVIFGGDRQYGGE